MQAFFDARGDAVAIRLPCRFRTSRFQPFEVLAQPIHGVTLRFRYMMGIN
ncbi:MAG: hypothetical protein WBE59_04310 [Candidatus Cybelea sp.]